jgi:hypothetical protein
MKLWNRRNFLQALTASTLTALGLSKVSAEPVITHSGRNLTSSQSVDLSLLLHCIAEVETGNDDSKVGKGGERSRYQISETVWRQHQDLTHNSREWMTWYFQQCCKGEDAQDIALRHLRWLDRHILRITPIERDFRAFALAWCWKGGLSSWGKAFSIPLNNYAVRVTNLYDDPQFKLAFRARQ